MLLKPSLFPNIFAEMVWENNENACTVDWIRMKVIQHNSSASQHPVPYRHISSTSLLWLKFKWAPSFCSNPATLSGNKVLYLFFILGTHSCDSPRGNSGKLRQNNCTWNSPPLSSVSQNVILRCVNRQLECSGTYWTENVCALHKLRTFSQWRVHQGNHTQNNSLILQCILPIISDCWRRSEGLEFLTVEQNKRSTKHVLHLCTRGIPSPLWGIFRTWLLVSSFEFVWTQMVLVETKNQVKINVYTFITNCSPVLRV